MLDGVDEADELIVVEAEEAAELDAELEAELEAELLADVVALVVMDDTSQPQKLPPWFFVIMSLMAPTCSVHCATVRTSTKMYFALAQRRLMSTRLIGPVAPLTAAAMALIV